MMAVIGWVTISVLFVAAGLFIYETAMLLAQAKENDQVICEWIAEVEENTEKADALLR
jgi:hypothetical protein